MSVGYTFLAFLGIVAAVAQFILLRRHTLHQLEIVDAIRRVRIGAWSVLACGFAHLALSKYTPMPAYAGIALGLLAFADIVTSAARILKEFDVQPASRFNGAE